MTFLPGSGRVNSVRLDAIEVSRTHLWSV